MILPITIQLFRSAILRDPRAFLTVHLGYRGCQTTRVDKCADVAEDFKNFIRR